MTNDMKPDLSVQTDAQAQIENRLKTTLELRSDGDIIDIAEIVERDWDRLYLFGENTSYSAINRTLGIPWLPDRVFYTAELTDLLVFVADGAVIEHVVINGDLFVAITRNEFLRGDATFEVREVEDTNRPKVLIAVQ